VLRICENISVLTCRALLGLNGRWIIRRDDRLPGDVLPETPGH
jgi:hypothetical protein